MLARLETTYLGILRVIILIVATLALMVAGVAFISAVPSLLRLTGVISGPETTGGTLGEYISARKATVPAGATAPAESDAAPTKLKFDPDVVAIANGLYDYLSGQQVATVTSLENSITAMSENTPPAARPAYLSDLKKLTAQLKASTGKKLTPADVDDLLRWHQQQFLSNSQAEAGKRAIDGAMSLTKFYVAGAAFTLFILIVFTFLFVKIERSLRVVRVVRTEIDHA